MNKVGMSSNRHDIDIVFSSYPLGKKKKKKTKNKNKKSYRYFRAATASVKRQRGPLSTCQSYCPSKFMICHLHDYDNSFIQDESRAKFFYFW